ncbi:pyridoxine 5'-phosphate synthase [Candidatus Peregrinibacteria bacterium]|nr:pyridoxine 5'-phosphate synthase [Candidatus Peregrinibacteria bacterium]
MAATEEMLAMAKKIKPGLITLVPEKRQELTTEGGLDVISQQKYLTNYLQNLHTSNLQVSIFINPNKKQIQAAKEIGADYVEIHTGPYAENPCKEELQRVKESITFGRSMGLLTNAGHGLNYENTYQIAQIPGIEQLHIGHSIISKAMLIGIKEAVQEMKEIIIKNSPQAISA